jgi:hypothetical protein
MTLESKFQRDTLDEIERMFPGCIILKNDVQGYPDRLILWRDKWAMLEFKRSSRAELQPNQQYWVDYFNELSFAAFIFPEKSEEVLDDLQRAFQSRRKARVPQR